jgi:hypothetical protein
MNSIISLTTIPSRVRHIKPCIDSLRQQGLPVYVWLQREVERTGNKFTGEIPEFLQGDGVHTTLVEERGPITKLLPALEMGAERIITADDDVIYGKGWAKSLIGLSRKLYTDCALYYRGRIFRQGDRHYNHTKLVFRLGMPQAVDLGTGTWGALYRSQFFDDDIYDLWKQWPLNDDLVINYYLRERGVRRIVIPQHCDITPLDGVYQINSLWLNVNAYKNDEGLEKLGWWRDA